MNCLICGSISKYFFSKNYDLDNLILSEIMQEVGRVDYFKCTCCGFVISDTHVNLNKALWERLNFEFHKGMEGANFLINQPPYLEQAAMICMLGNNGIVDTGDMLDYAAGYGTLSSVLLKYFNINLSVYDPYVNTKGCLKEIGGDKKYHTVINSAMFEHILLRDDLNQVDMLVADNGCLIVHTLVCENVPNDPNWFYFDPPVHTAFHTNKSMSILMEQWGYKGSVYSPRSKSWVLMRDYSEHVESAVKKINSELQCEWFLAKKGFVDYWKGF